MNKKQKKMLIRITDLGGSADCAEFCAGHGNCKIRPVSGAVSDHRV